MDIRWSAMLIPEHALLELAVRATLTYLGLFILVRVGLRRELGSLGVADLLLIFLFAEALQNSLVPDYRSITEGLFVVCVLIACNYAMDWLAFTFPAFERIVNPQPLLIVENGTVIHKNLRREMITLKELHRQLRKQGVDELEKVKTAHIEGDGKISVVLHDNAK